MNRKRGRKPKKELKELVRKLAQAPISYEEIRNILNTQYGYNIKSWQVVQYHFKN